MRQSGSSDQLYPGVFLDESFSLWTLVSLSGKQDLDFCSLRSLSVLTFCEFQIRCDGRCDHIQHSSGVQSLGWTFIPCDALRSCPALGLFTICSRSQKRIYFRTDTSYVPRHKAKAVTEDWIMQSIMQCPPPSRMPELGSGLPVWPEQRPFSLGLCFFICRTRGLDWISSLPARDFSGWPNKVKLRRKDRRGVPPSLPSSLPSRVFFSELRAERNWFQASIQQETSWLRWLGARDR